MPTAYNFTGQRLDSQTGLLYYNARYYDPISGRFVSADSVQNHTAGMDPYAYVGGNPETFSDPSGHCGFGGLGDVLDCATQAEQAVEQFVDTEPLPVVVVAAVTAPITLPLLAGELVVACLIGCSLGALAGVAYTLLAPQNLATEQFLL